MVEGLVLLAMGMITVFSFLIILVFTMIITYKILGYINKIFPEAVVEKASVKKIQATDDTEIAIAVAAAQRL